MTLVKRILVSPAFDPSAPHVPRDASGQPLYSVAHPPNFFETCGTAQIEAKSAMTVSQTVHLMQLTKVLQQLSNLSLYAHELFSDLTEKAKATSDRVSNLRQKVLGVQQLMPLVEKKMAVQANTSQLSAERQDWKLAPLLEQQLFTKRSADPAIAQTYATQCLVPPPLAQLDRFREDNQTSMKFYSYPQFFVEQWRLLMEKEQQARKKKKREKKSAGATKKTVVVSDVKVKRYNKAGELIADTGEPDTSQPAYDESELAAATEPEKQRAPSRRASRLSGLHSLAGDGGAPSQTTPSISEMMMSKSASAAMSTAEPLAEEQFYETVVPEVERDDAPPVPALKAPETLPPPPPSMAAPDFGGGVKSSMPSLTSSPPLPTPPPPPPPAPSGLGSVPSLAPAAGGPPAPPPPPPPGPPSGAPSMSSSALQDGASQLKPAGQRALAQPPPKDTRSNLMDNIKGGSFNLRKAVLQPKAKTSEAAAGNDVASILMRRIALEMSDSDSDDDEEEDKNDDWD